MDLQPTDSSLPNQDYSPPQTGKPMDEAALVAAIDDADNRAYGSALSNLTAALSAERAINIDLYLGKNLDPAPEGQSNVIDRTVFETVQWILPSLCNIFANGDDVVQLPPKNPADVPQAQQESAYLNNLVINENDWFSVFLEWATDCLLTKNGYILAYRDRKRSVSIEHYENQTKEGVAFLLADPEVKIIQSQQKPAPDLPPEPIVGPQGEPIIDGATGQPMTRPAVLYDVVVRRSNSTDKICIRTLPPERCKVDQRAFSWRLDDRCNYFEYWEELTLTEIREQGFDIPNDIADDPELYTQEDYARDQYGERRLERYKPSDPSMRRVKARMIWIRVDYDGDGIAELLQILRVGRRIFYMEEVSRIPVASAVAIPLPHRHIGVAVADITSDIQRIKTSILRQGLDNLYITNNPQKVLNENFVNMDDALISRPGGVIRATDINQIRYEDVPFVFPQAVEGLQYMDQVRQNRTGVNNSFAGIDGSQLDNIQPGTVNQLSSMAAQRVEQMARVLAFGVEDLFSILHELVLKMGHKRETLKLKGQWVDVDPGAFQKREKFQICVAFAAGNRDAQLQRLMAMGAQQMQLLELKVPIVQPENVYNTYLEASKAAGISSPERFWTDPASIPPQPPQPPPELIKAKMEIEGRAKEKAAELIQQEIESQRKAAIDKYGIDSQVGMTLIKTQQEHVNDVTLESLKASHAAATTQMAGAAEKTAGAVAQIPSSMKATHSAIQEHAKSLTEVSAGMSDLLTSVNKAVALATGQRRIRKNHKGEVEGVDVLDNDGNTLAALNVLRDQTGRITGLS